MFLVLLQYFWPGCLAVYGILCFFVLVRLVGPHFVGKGAVLCYWYAVFASVASGSCSGVWDLWLVLTGMMHGSVIRCLVLMVRWAILSPFILFCSLIYLFVALFCVRSHLAWHVLHTLVSLCRFDVFLSLPHVAHSLSLRVSCISSLWCVHT